MNDEVNYLEDIIDIDSIQHNEKMKNESDRLHEYLEMKAMYEDGLLEY